MLAVVGHLAPGAQLVLPRGARVATCRTPGGRGLESSSPGWVRVLNDQFEPAFGHPSVSTVRYRCDMPLHPGRLMGLLADEWTGGEFGMIVRSAGFCRFATRPGVTGFWDQAGATISFDPAARDDAEVLSIGQDLAITGFDLDAEALATALDACALTPAEFLAGADIWLVIDDPLPAWVDCAA